MPIAIKIDKITGLPICPCCRLNLYNCKKCWNKYHHGEEHNDYKLPEYFGQPFISEEITKRMEKEFNIKKEPQVKPNKNRKYKEGDYAH